MKNTWWELNDKALKDLIYSLCYMNEEVYKKRTNKLFLFTWAWWEFPSLHELSLHALFIGVSLQNYDCKLSMWLVSFLDVQCHFLALLLIWKVNISIRIEHFNHYTVLDRVMKFKIISFEVNCDTKSAKKLIWKFRVNSNFKTLKLKLHDKL